MSQTKIKNGLIEDDNISYEKVDNEFKTSSAVSGVGGTSGDVYEIDFDAAQIFTFTLGANAGVLDVANPKIGMTKVIIVTGGGYTMPISWDYSGTGDTPTFNKIAGDYDDTLGTKNFIQLICVSSTEFWYSISQIAS